MDGMGHTRKTFVREALAATVAWFLVTVAQLFLIVDGQRDLAIVVTLGELIGVPLFVYSVWQSTKCAYEGKQEPEFLPPIAQGVLVVAVAAAFVAYNYLLV